MVNDDIALYGVTMISTEQQNMGTAAKAGEHSISEALSFLHYSSPLVIFSLFILGFIVHGVVVALRGDSGRPSTAATKSNPEDDSNDDIVAKNTKGRFSWVQKQVFNWLSVGIVATFVANAVAIIVHALKVRPWWADPSMTFYVVASVFVYGGMLISLVDTPEGPSAVHFVTWIESLVLELALLFVLLHFYNTLHPGNSMRDLPFYQGPSKWESVTIAISLLRVALLVILVGVYAALAFVGRANRLDSASGDASPAGERASLLGGEEGQENQGQGYGATAQKSKQESEVQAGWARPNKVPAKNWWEYLRNYTFLFPYLWPSKSRRLQIMVVVCFGITLLQRGVNVLVPYQLGRIVDGLSGEDGQGPRIPWLGICLYIVYRILQGGTGLLGALRAWLWIPIGQYSYQALSTTAFEHVHTLSLDFHIGKRTGEVLSALSKGSSINSFLEQITFSILPMLVDLGVAVGYFLVAWDAYYALVVAIISVSYLYVTIRMAQWRADIRRDMVNTSREEEAVKNDSLVSYETVKYFNAEHFEFNRYRNAVSRFQQAEYKVFYTLNLMNVTQNLIFTAGLMVVCFISAYQVTDGQHQVGQFVTLLTYMAQLQVPLNYFGSFFRSIQSAMINAERMLELLKERPNVVDGPNARQLPTCDGEICFDNVDFSYDERKSALKGCSFTVPPGTTTALVGESGGGKSTVFRLLFRFYDTTGGNISVDGNNVSDLTIDSLRSHMGVVPQDTILFNETLMYNLKYANQEATDEEVFEACRAASIHDKILGFPDGYSTKVGERGLRLSGGEKQRVAIARTILKNPRIILLDEATAALDSETEEHIQGALEELGKGRTMLIIAHRLSTVVSANQILCLNEGKVAEAGTHEELLAMRGRYAGMWRRQIRAERVAEEARVLSDRAERLRLQTANSNAASAETSENESDRTKSNSRPQTRPSQGDS